MLADLAVHNDRAAAEGRPQPEVAGDSAARALAMSRAAAAALASVGSRVHTAWLETLGCNIAQHASTRPALLDELVLAGFDLRWPDLSASTSPLEHLWVLPPAEVRRVCLARALYGWRDALLRCVEGQVRRTARVLLGESVFRTLTARPSRRPRAKGLPPALDSDDVCALGWLSISQALPWRDVRSRRLTELMLPPLCTRGSVEPGKDDDDSQFAADLPAMFPEYAWLFGSGLATTR